MAATNKRGVFSLETVLERQDSNNWVKIPEVFRYVNSVAVPPSPVGTDFGYFMGGMAECCPYLAPFSTVDRLDFSNDTDNMVTKASLTEVKTCRGYSSFTHGYAAGGWSPAAPGQVTTIDRIDYASDTTAQTAKGPLEIAVASNAVGLHNTEYGYTLGGGTPSYVSYNQRLDFSSDTSTTSPKGNLTTAAGWGAGSGNQSYGYYSGGLTPSYISTVQRLDYSSDTTTMAPKGPLSREVKEHDAAGNADYGYHAGGWDPGTPYATMNDRIDYSNDTATALLRGLLGYPGRHGPSATGNTSYGYWTGGYGNTTNSYRLDYSSDTTQMSVKGKRTSFSQNGAGVSSRANAMPLTSGSDIVPATRTEARPVPAGTNYGYIGGGHDSSGRLSSIDRIDIANDTATALVKGKMTVQRRGHAGTGSLTHGYQGGDDVPGSKSSVSRIDFSNDTADAAIVGRMSYAQPGGGAASGNKDFGYFVGGNVSNVSRVDYSNDSATQSSKGPLAAAMWYLGGTGNQSYGYFTGGYPAKSTLNRIDYGNYTATAATKGNQSTGRYGQGASGNASYAYFAGGRSSSVLSTVDRLDYANDTPNMVVKGPLSSTGYYISSFGNSEYGWFCARRPDKSVVDRIDFANDTATASIRGPLTATRKYAAASSSRQYNNPTTSTLTVTVDKGAGGYQTGGSLGPAFGYAIAGQPSLSQVDRIDYANDTATAAVKGSLSQTFQAHQSTSNLTHAYVAAGYPSPSKTSVDRIEFANDTSTGTPKGPLSAGRQYFGATGNTSFGYYAGGAPSNISSVDRIDYGNDTATASPKGPLSFAKGNSQACGNMSFGYWAGGAVGPSPRSSVDRIDYSSDTSTASPKGNLESGRSTMVASGTSNFGYWSGGFPYYTKTSRIDYSNDTATAVAKAPYPSAVSPYGHSNAAGTGSSTHGYVFGGNGYLTYVWRIDYENDTANAVSKGPLSLGRIRFSGASAQENGMASPLSFIPRIRWVDSVAETPAVAGGPPYGYTALGKAGPSSSPTSSVERIDFNNDTATASPKGPMASVGYMGGAAGNLSYGWWGGFGVSSGGPSTSIVNRVDYGNDTATASPKGNLNRIASLVNATGNANYGYWGGGYDHSAGVRSYVSRVDYSNDSSTASPKGDLSHSQWGAAALGTQSYGYFAGGNNTAVSNVSRIDFSNDTATASPKGNLSAVDNWAGGAGNASYGWIGGGTQGSPGNAVSQVDRIDYSNDTATASPKGPLSVDKQQASASGSDSYGYWGTGTAAPNTTFITTVDRIDYSNDTATALVKGSMTDQRRLTGGVSGRENGLRNSSIAAIAAPYQPPFSVPTQLSVPAPSMGYTLGSGTYVQRIDYANDTATAPTKGPLSAVASYHSAVSSTTHGYTFGGPPGPGNSLIQRIDYLNDTATAPTVANLAQPVYRTYSGMGNKTYGYQSGGQRPSTTGTSNIDRIEYANDTATGLQKGNLASSRYLQTATGNLSYGYVCGGSPPFQNNSLVQRVDYGNDTATASPKGPLHQGSRKLSSAGTADYGYVAGGTNPELSSTTRIDYSNDTATSVQKGSMTRTRRNFGGMSSPAYAYYTAGAMPYPTPALTSTDRLDYANDTATASPKGPLSASVSYFSAASPQDIAGALQ